MQDPRKLPESDPIFAVVRTKNPKGFMVVPAPGFSASEQGIAVSVMLAWFARQFGTDATASIIRNAIGDDL